VWLMNGATTVSATYVMTVDPGYAVVGSGDLNGDAKTDIVWRGSGGDVWVWLMNGATPTSMTYVTTVGDLGYQIVGVADHTGDGKADILWWHNGRGEVWLWPMNGAALVSQSYVGAVPDTGYRIVAKRRLRRGRQGRHPVAPRDAWRGVAVADERRDQARGDEGGDRAGHGYEIVTEAGRAVSQSRLRD